jgi:hypothetical protein
MSLVSMVQCMNEEPASPDQRVPSQSKTAMRGFRAWTRAWNSGVVRGVVLADKKWLRRRGGRCCHFMRAAWGCEMGGAMEVSAGPNARSGRGRGGPILTRGQGRAWDICESEGS